jgi:group II intron reverse transcriptase/maturase
MTVDLLRESYYALRRNAAVGVDGVTWTEYGEGLEARLEDLHERVHSERYRAQPSRRIWIPKADGRQRPIGIASLEDKIIQQAMVSILNAIYEVDFADHSYGFRPGRSPHNALDVLFQGITRGRVNWVLDADIRSFFDTLDHGWLMKFLEKRIGDPRVLRLIRKWLVAGTSESGGWTRTNVGTPQGAVISPLLANVYLHYALDLGVRAWQRREAHGEALIVRYADDFVMGFEQREDAQAFLAWLEARLLRFGLELHGEKTRLIEFGRHAAANRQRRGEGKPETFDFLGFTHICGKTRKRGCFTVHRRTKKQRMSAKLKELRQTLMRRRHEPVPDQGAWLKSVVQGHLNYFAVPGNTHMLTAFRTQVVRAWHGALRRRSQKGTRLNWNRMRQLEARWIPPVRILHPYPSVRLGVSYPR